MLNASKLRCRLEARGLNASRPRCRQEATRTLHVVPKSASSLLEVILLSLQWRKRFSSYRSSEKSTWSIMASSLCHDKKSRTQMQIMELMQINVVITKMRFKAYGVIRQVVR